MKCIYIAVEQGFEARTLLRSGIYPVLLESGIPIVIMTPNPDEEYFRGEFARHGVHLEKYDIERSVAYYQGSTVQRFIAHVRAYSLPASAHFHYLDDKAADDVPFLDEKTARLVGKLPSRSAHRMLNAMIWLCRHLRIVRRSWGAMENRRYAGDWYDELFDRLPPGMVIVPVPGYHPHDTYLQRQARKRGAQLVCLFPNWDQPKNRLGSIPPDLAVVWSEIMKENVETYQNVPADRIFIGGTPNFDIYFHPEKLLSREELFGKLGLDPARRVIFFGTKSPTKFANYRIIEILAEALDAGALPRDAQLLVRLHPIHDKPDYARSAHSDWLRKRYEAIKRRHPNVVFNRANILSRKLRVDLDPNEPVEVASILKHSDVLVTTFSTLVLEACLTDTPVVNISFDPDPAPDDVQEYRPISVDRAQPHIKRVADFGSTRLAESSAELIEHVRAYLDDRTLEAKERRVMAEAETGPTDGSCGRRIGERLLQFYLERAGRP